MKATVMDLRYRMGDVVRALERNETVTLLYRGKEKGVIYPRREKSHRKVADHAFYGIAAERDESVEEEMANLRGSRY